MNLPSLKLTRTLARTLLVVQSVAASAFGQSPPQGPATAPSSAPSAARSPATAPSSAPTSAPSPATGPSPLFTVVPPPPIVPLRLLVPVPVPAAKPGPSTPSRPAAVPAPAPTPTPPAGVEIHFDANQEGVALAWRRDNPARAQDTYKYVADDSGDLCIAPCDTRLPQAKLRMALSLRGDDPVEVKEPVMVSAATTLRGTYLSQGKTRALGILAIVGGIVSGALLDAIGVTVATENNPWSGWLVFGIGNALGIGAVVVGTVLVLKKDTATIEVMPQTIAPVGATLGWSPERVAGLTAGEGLVLRVRF
jgi:hypothetical protein